MLLRRLTSTGTAPPSSSWPRSFSPRPCSAGASLPASSRRRPTSARCSDHDHVDGEQHLSSCEQRGSRRRGENTPCPENPSPARRRRLRFCRSRLSILALPARRRAAMPRLARRAPVGTFTTTDQFEAKVDASSLSPRPLPAPHRLRQRNRRVRGRHRPSGRQGHHPETRSRTSTLATQPSLRRLPCGDRDAPMAVLPVLTKAPRQTPPLPSSGADWLQSPWVGVHCFGSGGQVRPGSALHQRDILMRTALRTLTALALAVPLLASTLPASASSTLLYREKGTFADAFFRGGYTVGAGELHGGVADVPQRVWPRGSSTPSPATPARLRAATRTVRTPATPPARTSRGEEPLRGHRKGQEPLEHLLRQRRHCTT